MGAWGYKAFDNDQALDWVSTVVDEKLWGKIKTALEGDDHDEIRAAADVTIALLSRCRGVAPHKYDIRKIAYDALDKVMNDSSWLDSWDSPASVIAGISQQKRDLQDIDQSTTLSDILQKLDPSLDAVRKDP